MKNGIEGKRNVDMTYNVGKPSEGRFPFPFILIIFVLIGFGIRLYISWQDFVLLFQKCVVDDACFYLNIAKNISIGKGATFDGSILTNGFHPIYALILVPLFWVIPSNPDLTFHLALTVLSVFNILTSVVIFLIVKEISGRPAALIASFIWLFNPYVIMISLNGVEVGVATFFLALCMYQYIKMHRRDAFNTRNIILTGIFTALAVLSRVDSVFIMISIAFFILIASYQKNKKITASLKEPAFFSLVTLAVLSPWFLWNVYHFGTIRQISGVTLPNIAHNMYLMKYGTYMSLQFVKTQIYNLKIWIENIVRFGGGLPLFILAVIFFIWISRKNLMKDSKKLLAHMKIMNFALLSVLLLISFYALYFWGWFRPWYYLSVVLTVTICLGIFAGHIMKAFQAPNRVGLVRARYLTILLLGLTFYFSYQGSQIWKKGLFPFQKQLYDSAVWMNENTPSDSRIGAISSGVYGYITHRTTDLLGVVNAEAYQAMREKKFFEYLQKKDIEYLIDREDMINFFNNRFDRQGFLDKVVLIKRFGDMASDVVVYKIINGRTEGKG